MTRRPSRRWIYSWIVGLLDTADDSTFDDSTRKYYLFYSHYTLDSCWLANTHFRVVAAFFLQQYFSLLPVACCLLLLLAKLSGKHAAGRDSCTFVSMPSDLFFYLAFFASRQLCAQLVHFISTWKVERAKFGVVSMGNHDSNNTTTSMRRQWQRRRQRLLLQLLLLLLLRPNQ